uniref:PCI domain-containing protein n=1 Tax=Colobus angolensis palliatus TaxID=336983 RepID=A0A2K5IXV2_COLAP
MSAEVKVTGQNQEQFLLLAKSAKGAALATLIHQVLEAPGVYVFGELLDMPNVRELAESDFASTFRLLTVFAYGTYADYLAEARNLPPLTEAQKNKLRHLSVVTLAAKVKCIPYAVLLEALALRNVRQLEDLVIEAVYADVLRGSLDQRNQRLEVDYSIGRDIQRQDLNAIARTLQEWCVGCEVVLSGIEEQVSRANQHKEQQLGLKQQIESEAPRECQDLVQVELKGLSFPPWGCGVPAACLPLRSPQRAFLCPWPADNPRFMTLHFPPPQT